MKIKHCAGCAYMHICCAFLVDSAPHDSSSELFNSPEDVNFDKKKHNFELQTHAGMKEEKQTDSERKRGLSHLGTTVRLKNKN